MTAAIKDRPGSQFMILKQVCICDIYFNIETQFLFEENKNLAAFNFVRILRTAELLQLNIGHILYMVCTTVITQSM